MVSFSSKISLVLFFLLCATTLFNISNCSNNIQVVRCNEKDQLTLSMFKAGVLDLSNRLSSWSNNEDCCSWIGVLCDNLTGRVTMFDLRGFEMGGEVNLSLLQLQFLNYLDLSFNSFSAISIPPFLLSKSPPNISINLQYLDLSMNYFGMDNLHWLSPFSSLKYLDLTGINLSNETSWLHSVAILPSLSELYLTLCELKLPNWLFNLTSAISYIDLSHNLLSGYIPSTLGNLSSLIYLDLSSNHLNGNLPKSLGQLSNLESLNLEGNSLVGVITEETFSKLSSLETLNLDSTGLELDLDSNYQSLYLGMGVGFAVSFWVVCGSIFCIRAWRHRFFRWFDDVVDGVYVAMALKFKSFSS
ncbi:receptor-like protein EIX2 [Senna tora]|uniref:Receptor-like protein EIX2 n=1 Tax=Senna tora TaxID=362788 RepID=A0A834T834_9FABA|nr:receptor-like protein EIX2 [Senna tora]